MKSTLLLIVCLVFLIACTKKEDNTPATSQTPLVRTISFDSTVAASYWYDGQGRLTCSRMFESPGIDSAVYTYGSNTMVKKLYYDGVLSETEYGLLENGNVVSLHGNKPDSSSYWSTQYTYDANGFLIREIHMDNDTVETWRAEYVVTDGNIMSMNRSNYIPVIYTYEYYPGTVNSLGSTTTFLGKTSKNLVKRLTIAYDIGTITEDYTYEYYNNGWVKKMTQITSGDTLQVYITYW